MKTYLFDLLKTQESNYVTASFLSMKNSIRGAPVQVYANQFNSDTFENTPLVDVDVHGYVVSSPNLNIISIHFKASCFESGPMPTPTKSRNPTIVGFEDPNSTQLSHPKVLFTLHYTWLNFCLRLLHLVNRESTQLFMRRKSCKRKFYHV